LQLGVYAILQNKQGSPGMPDVNDAGACALALRAATAAERDAFLRGQMLCGRFLLAALVVLAPLLIALNV
jgi:hypothetical protein